MTRKKILFVRPSLAHGGADKVTVNLLNQIDLNRFDPSLGLMHMGGEMQSQLSSEIPVINFACRSLWLAVWPIHKELKKNNYDVVYSTSGGMGIPMLLACKLARFKGLKVVSERSSLKRFSSSKFKKKALLFFKKNLYHSADRVTVVSESIKGEVEELLDVKRQQIHVVYNPLVGKELFDKAKKQVSDRKFNASKFPVLAAGRLEDIKDYPTMLRGFKGFRDQVGEGDLFILGKGSKETSIKALVDELELTDCVHLLGFQENPFAYMAKAKVFLLTSRFEGMPGVLIQSMALETICISTDCPTGPNELIQNNENGYLIPVGDSSALSTTLFHIFNDYDSLQKLKDAASKSVAKYQTAPALNSYLSFIN